jgi:hypothetical protein
MQIKISYHSEVFIRIFAEPSIEQELSDFFKFRVDGYQFTPKFKAKLWDGYLRLYNLQTKTLYAGLIDYVVDFANRNHYEIEIDSNIGIVNNYDINEIKIFTESLKLYGKGQPINIRDYQIDGIHIALNRNRTLLLSPTACLDPQTIIEVVLDQDAVCFLQKLRSQQ